MITLRPEFFPLVLERSAFEVANALAALRIAATIASDRGAQALDEFGFAEAAEAKDGRRIVAKIGAKMQF